MVLINTKYVLMFDSGNRRLALRREGRGNAAESYSLMGTYDDNTIIILII